MKEDIVESFNRIALLDDKWDHNRHYEKLILKEIDNTDGNALDIGCGTGEFTRKLSRKVKSVCGIDISPVMIGQALKRHNEDNIKYEIMDFNEFDGKEQYDYIVSIAAFHHLDLKSILPKIQGLLKNNGKLIVLDLYERKGFADRILDCIAVPANFFLRVVKNGVAVSTEEKEAWKEHGNLDRYMAFRDISDEYRKYLSQDIEIKRLLFWRYMLVYKKG